MLDELLGRAELKSRIEELEDENASLRAQLDAESERRSEAVRDRQDAEQRVNELQQRVTELQDRVDRLSGGEDGAEPEFRGRLDVRGERLERVLTLLDSVASTEEGVLTAYVPDDPPEAVREAFGDRAPLVERAAPCLVVRDVEGVLSAALRPPNPPGAFCEWTDSVRVAREWLAPTGRYALAVVRADLFAVGVYEAGDGGRPERVAFEGFESDVKGTHSKGGFSQDRFERRRESQIDDHLEKCHDALADVAADRTFVVGEGTLLGEFDADATAAVDATGKPEDALAAAHEDFWTVPLSLL